MKSIKKIVTIALTGVLMFSVVGCGMIEKTDAAKKKTVVAKVNGDKITLGEVDMELASWYELLKQQAGENYKEDEKVKELIAQRRKQTLDGLVNDKILQSKAKELNLIPADDELNKEADKKFEELKAKLGDNFETAMKNEGFTEESLKEFLKDQIKAEKVIDNIIKDINVTDEDVEKYYNENKAAFTQHAGAQTKHILFETEEQAKEAKAKIDAGTSFDELFKEYSKNKAENKKPLSEDLGFVEYNKQGFDPEFLAGLKELKEGQVSGPVKSSFGYHIIQATKIQSEDKVEPLDDQLKTKIKGYLDNQKKNEAIKNTVEQWKKDMGVKVYEERLKENI